MLKPKHSGFYATALGTLVHHLGATRLILTGINGDTCVLATAMEAYLRDFELYVPADCVASIQSSHNRNALAYMRRVLGARTTPAARLDLGQLAGASRRARTAARGRNFRRPSAGAPASARRTAL